MSISVTRSPPVGQALRTSVGKLWNNWEHTQTLMAPTVRNQLAREQLPSSPVRISLTRKAANSVAPLALPANSLPQAPICHVGARSSPDFCGYLVRPVNGRPQRRPHRESLHVEMKPDM